MTKHQHCDMIIAWANGAQIQVHVNGDLWDDCKEPPGWFPWCKYRVKPTKTVQMRPYLTKLNTVRVWTDGWTATTKEVEKNHSFSKWLGPVEERTFDV